MTSTSGKSTEKNTVKASRKSTGKAAFKKFAKLALMTCALALGCNTHTFAEEHKEITTLTENDIQDIARNVVTNFTLSEYFDIGQAFLRIVTLDKPSAQDINTAVNFLFTNINTVLENKKVKQLNEGAKKDIEEALKKSAETIAPQIQQALKNSLGEKDANSLQEISGLMLNFAAQIEAEKLQTIKRLQTILNGLQIRENLTFNKIDFPLTIKIEDKDIKLNIPDILKEFKPENLINKLKGDFEETKKDIDQYLKNTEKGINKQGENIKNSNVGDHFTKPFIEISNSIGALFKR